MHAARFASRSVVLAAAAVALSGGVRPARPASTRAGGVAQPVAREVYLMGTRATLATYETSRARALARLDRLLEALEETEAELSTWRIETPLSRLNRQPLGRPLRLPRGACHALAESFRWHEATGGAFDPTVGRLVAVWGIRQAGCLPSASELARARRLTGLGYLHLERRSCEVVREREVEIDSGGFGKGAALDRAAAASPGGPWLIDLGGQVMAEGSPPGSEGWEVLVAHPTRRDEPILSLRLTGGSLATSSGSERDLTVRGVRVGHILDPRTGRPAPFEGSVTVWHPSGLVADILSTALYVMGLEEGLAWADAHEVAACFSLARQTGAGEPRSEVVDLEMSRAFARRFAHLRRLVPPPARAVHLPGGLPISK